MMFESGGKVTDSNDAPRQADGDERSVPVAAWRWLMAVDRWPPAITCYALVAGVVCFWRLGASGLVSMEGMVVDGARQMLASGNWIVPRVYGELYTYKPALVYWLGSLPLRLSELPPEWSVRLPFAALGFALGAVTLGLVGRLVGSRMGLFSALAVVCGVLFQQKVRIAEFDVALMAGVGVAVVAACYNLAAREERLGVWLLGYLGLTSGLLAKGGPAVLAYGPGVLLAAVVLRRFRQLFGWRHLVAASLFVLLTGGYLWAAWELEGRAAFEQPLLEAKARGLGWLWGETEEAAAELAAFREGEGRAEIEGGASGAAVRAVAKPLIVWGVALPWALLLPAAFWRHRSPIADPVVARLVGAGRSFLIGGAAAFMLTATHESRYYLPLTVPLGILCGVVAADGFALSDRWHRAFERTTFGAAGLVALLTVSLAVVLTTPPVSVINRVALGIIGVVALGWLVSLEKRRARGRIVGYLIVMSLCLLAAWSLGLEPRRAGTRNLREPALEAARLLPAGAPVWTLGPADVAGKNASLYFYLGRSVRVFRPGDGLPPAGSWCIVPSDRLPELEAIESFSFHELERIEHVRRDFHVGTCSASRDLDQ